MEAVLSKIRFRDPQIEMAHGAGGKASRRLVEGLFAPLLFGDSTEPLGDAAHLEVGGTRIAFTADSFSTPSLSGVTRAGMLPSKTFTFTGALPRM